MVNFFVALHDRVVRHLGDPHSIRSNPSSSQWLYLVTARREQQARLEERFGATEALTAESDRLAARQFIGPHKCGVVHLHLIVEVEGDVRELRSRGAGEEAVNRAGKQWQGIGRIELAFSFISRTSSKSRVLVKE